MNLVSGNHIRMVLNTNHSHDPSSIDPQAEPGQNAHLHKYMDEAFCSGIASDKTYKTHMISATVVYKFERKVSPVTYNYTSPFASHQRPKPVASIAGRQGATCANIADRRMLGLPGGQSPIHQHYFMFFASPNEYRQLIAWKDVPTKYYATNKWVRIGCYRGDQ